MVDSTEFIKTGISNEICTEIKDVSVVTEFGRVQEVFKELGTCIRNEFDKVQLAVAAARYQIVFDTTPLNKALSSLGIVDLQQFLTLNLFTPWDTLLARGNGKPSPRNSFNDQELAELTLLLGVNEKAFFSFGQSIARFFQKRPGLASIAPKVSDRYAAMVGLVPTLSAEPYSYNRFLINLLIAKFQWGLEALRVPDELVRTYAIEALVPLEGMELAPLSAEDEDPLLVAVSKIAFMGGTFDLRPGFRNVYKEFRGLDNPQIAEHPVAAENAARVAVFDSGIDFGKVPELGLFLSAGRPGEVGNADYADEDSNPYLPALDSNFGHGSGTTASVLTLFSKMAPQLLRERKLDLGVWKLDTIRETLSGPFMGSGLFSSRPLVVAEGIIREVYHAQEAAKAIASGKNVSRRVPHIVSVSLGFRIFEAMVRTGFPKTLEDSPWLWVMAAGNESSLVEERNFSCFQDVPAELRPDARILCVGALKRPVIGADGQPGQAQIASYSNYGKRVDVYAYESYTELCPNGTSCSTPAVAGAAGIIKASFPNLTPEQIKSAIVKASRMVELSVEAGDRAAKTDTVPVFDPETDMPRALEIAAQLAKGGIRPVAVNTR